MDQICFPSVRSSIGAWPPPGLHNRMGGQGEGGMTKGKRPRLSVCLDSAAPKGGTQVFCCTLLLPLALPVCFQREMSHGNTPTTLVQAKRGEGPASVYCTPQCMIVRPTAERKGKWWSGCNCIFWESGAEEAQRRKKMGPKTGRRGGGGGGGPPSSVTNS